MDKRAKRVADSVTEQVHILMPADINGANRLFGGVLMQWIDIVAAVVARRHSNSDVTTATVDSLEFCAPAHMNDTVALWGKITHVGRTSMEIRVDTFVEEMEGGRKLVNRAYMVMVAIDKNDCPQPVPELILETEEERAEWEAAEKRRERRKRERRTNYL